MAESSISTVQKLTVNSEQYLRGLRMHPLFLYNIGMDEKWWGELRGYREYQHRIQSQTLSPVYVRYVRVQLFCCVLHVLYLQYMEYGVRTAYTQNNWPLLYGSADQCRISHLCVWLNCVCIGVILCYTADITQNIVLSHSHRPHGGSHFAYCSTVEWVE